MTPDSNMVGATVVVPTLNRGDYLYDSLLDLLEQEHRPLEILVVDQSAEVPARIQQLVDAHSEIISYHRVSFRGLPLARNYGWQYARYDAIVYVDDDVRCSPNFVSEHLRALQLPNVGAVAGAISERGRQTEPKKRAGKFHYWTAVSERYFSQNGEYDVDGVAGCNFSTWRDIAREVKGFDERLNVGAALYEETEYSLHIKRAGYRIYYNSRAFVDHLVSPSGGCRVEEVDLYVRALAHNRSIIIQRYLKIYQQPVALSRLLITAFAYALRYKRHNIIPAAFRGIYQAYGREKR